jgi:tRNA(adenine34) deaminase
MAGLVPAIHVFYVAPCIKTWARHTRLVPGPAGGRTRVPGTTSSMATPSFMQIALGEARAAGARGEVPVGCVIVRDNKMIARAGNRTLADRDPTAHAELIAIRAAATALGSERLTDCDLYVTLEPCAMCAAAISFARIRRLYFGAADPKGGAVEHGVRFFAVATCHHRPEIYGGISERECAALLKEFFQARRS